MITVAKNNQILIFQKKQCSQGTFEMGPALRKMSAISFCGHTTADAPTKRCLLREVSVFLAAAWPEGGCNQSAGNGNQA